MYKKYFHQILIISMLFLITVMILQLNYDQTFLQFNKIYSIFANISISQNNNADHSGCNFPILNPWDPEIQRYIEHPKPVTCPKIQPFLSYIDVNGKLTLNSSEIKQLEERDKEISCSYRTFDRSLGLDDNSLAFHSKKPLTVDHLADLDEDMVEVSCSNKNGSNIYANIHAHPAFKSNRIFGHESETQLSVLMIIIDSISLSGLQRNMPLTFDYITKTMGFHTFKKFNKIADNTFPNMMAALIGKRVNYEQPGMQSEMSENFRQIRYDHWPMIWKFFAANGYATMFNEDKPEWGIFHYLKRGFTKKPVDYYYHTYWVAQRLMNEGNVYKKDCFGNYPKIQLQLDIARRHLTSMNGNLQFMFNFFTELSHDYINKIESGDEYFRNFWKHIFDGNYLNHTAVIFMSDHGNRFSSIRNTLTGLLEERLPFYGIWFPEWLYEKNSGLNETLAINVDRYTSTFDVHETLKDILTSNFAGTDKNPIGQRGLSQLRPLPLSRTCREAGVPDHFCVCFKSKSLNVSDASVRKGAEALVEELNSLLSNLTNLCHVIKLDEILHAEEVDFDEMVIAGVNGIDEAKEFKKKKEKNRKKQKRQSEKMRISVVTQPQSARFEATFIKQSEEKFVLHGDISRISSYAGKSECVEDTFLKKICSCISV